MINKISLINGDEIVVRSGDIDGKQFAVELDDLGVRVIERALTNGTLRTVETSIYPWSAILAFKIAY